ncbi:MAG: NAD/NADP octopine/nopaline dehydrogenase family protein [Deltaproteobacteria bacterium]|nr:MAG: NAD/NADP octopine/nopaline dehydrogenase family protein [Deltaproteobacteria bacterium]
MGNKKIAVLGGGNGAHTMAADLTLKGYNIAMCEAPEFKEGIKRILDRQAIDLIDAWGERHTIGINMVTTDFQEALKGASYIMIAVPAFASASFFRRIIPFLEDGQTIIKWSANFSALQFAALLKEQGIKKDITLAEAHTLPWGCRLVEPGTAQIMVWAVKLMLATLPARHTERVIKEVQPMYPVVKGENVLATTLNNLNPIVHPVGTVMNAGWVDSAGKDFYLYRDGNTVSVSRGIKRVFEEVSQVAGAIGVTMLDYPEEDFWKKSTIMSTYFKAVFDREGMVNKISGPESVKSRYITEDLPYGLVPIRKFAQQYGISTPLIDAVIEFGSVINQTDYMKEGISLEELGIAGLSKDDLKQVIDEGFC